MLGWEQRLARGHGDIAATRLISFVITGMTLAKALLPRFSLWMGSPLPRVLGEQRGLKEGVESRYLWQLQLFLR